MDPREIKLGNRQPGQLVVPSCCRVNLLITGAQLARSRKKGGVFMSTRLALATTIFVALSASALADGVDGVLITHAKALAG
jgi:hypothetical protein